VELSSGQFTDFLRILDLSSCEKKHVRLIQELGPSVSNNPTAALRDLWFDSTRSLARERTSHEGSVGVYDKEALSPFSD